MPEVTWQSQYLNPDLSDCAGRVLVRDWVPQPMQSGAFAHLHIYAPWSSETAVGSSVTSPPGLLVTWPGPPRPWT